MPITQGAPAQGRHVGARDANGVPGQPLVPGHSSQTWCEHFDDINMQYKQRWHDWTLHSKNLQVNKNNAEKIKRARFSLVKTENYGMYNSHSWVDAMQDELIT